MTSNRLLLFNNQLSTVNQLHCSLPWWPSFVFIDATVKQVTLNVTDMNKINRIGRLEKNGDQLYGQTY